MKRILIIVLAIMILATGGGIFITNFLTKTEVVTGPVYREPVEGVTYKKDIPYQKGQNHNCYLDLAYDEKAEKQPLLILVHGGAWSTGDKKNLADFFYTFAGRGYVVANVNYDLISLEADKIGKISIMKQEAYIRDAINYLFKNADQYGIDTEQIYLAGHSAGGQLVGNLVEKDNLPIAGLILLSAASDFRYFLYNTANTTGDTKDVPMTLLPFIFDGKIDQDIITEINKVDVLTNINPDMPRTLILHGDFDDTIPYTLSEKLYQEMTKAGCQVELMIIHKMKHNPAITEVCDQMDTFMKQDKGGKKQ